MRDLAQRTQAGEEPVRQLLKKLARQGLVFQPVKDLFYAAPAMDALAALLRTLAAQGTTDGAAGSADGGAGTSAAGAAVQAHVFRDATGLGRKRAIQLLEFFNRIGYTRRVGDGHLLRPDAQWQAATEAGAPANAKANDSATAGTGVGIQTPENGNLKTAGPATPQ